MVSYLIETLQKYCFFTILQNISYIFNVFFINKASRDFKRQPTHLIIYIYSGMMLTILCL